MTSVERDKVSKQHDHYTVICIIDINVPDADSSRVDASAGAAEQLSSSQQ